MANRKLLTSAIGTVAALSFSIGSYAGNTDNVDPFEAEALDSGFMSAQASFGDKHKDKDKDEEGSCGEGSCGEDKDEEGSCGEGSCGEDKDEEGSCGEGSCGEDDEEKDEEGSCGESIA